MYFHAKDFGKGSCTGHKLILKGTNFRLEQGSKICAFTLFKDLWDHPSSFRFVTGLFLRAL